MFEKNRSMFLININSILLIVGLSKLLMGLLMYHLKVRMPRFKAINYWGLGSIITACGFILYAFFPYPTTRIINFGFSFTLSLCIYIGDVLFLTGFYILRGAKPNKLLYGLLIFDAVNIIVFSLVYKLIWMRFFLNTLSGAILYTFSAIEMLKHKTKSVRPLFILNSCIYFLYVFLQLMRAITSLLYRPENPMIDTSNFSILLLALTGISLTMLTYNLIIIINSIVNDQLTEQLTLKNKLYSIISHDLRGGLSNLFNYNAILAKSFKNWNHDKINHWITDMKRMSLSSLNLMENLFQWSETHLNELNLTKQSVDVTQIINQIIMIMKHESDAKNIQIQFDDTNHVFAYCDVNMISAVIRNLMSNAIKFTKRSGRIIIRIIDNANNIIFSIEDTGIGISPEIIPVIFANSFYSTKGTMNEKGSGFGLRICKEFIDLHNGQIFVESNLNSGSIFSFTLPKN